MMAFREDSGPGDRTTNTPVDTFDHFWHTFDERYGLFDVKHLNWDSIYTAFRPRVHNDMTDEQLYKVLCEMIVLLNDNHVNLYPTNGTLENFPGGVLRYTNKTLTILKAQEDYDLEVVKPYLKEFHEPTGSIRYGLLPGNIGYLNFTGHTDSRKTTQRTLETILHALQNTDALILDIRGDTGGHDALAQWAAGRFAASDKVYMVTRKRNGPGHRDFTELTEWHVEPTGDYQYTRPVIVLTSRFTQSAGETFTLALRAFNHVRVLGDTTAGSYSDNPTLELPNGWMFSISIGDYRTPDGKSYEGTGTPPDSVMRNTRQDLLAGKDVVLEKALQWLAK